jgi:hypothetical protein
MYQRRDFEVLRAQLDNERSTFTAHWRDLADHILPRRQRFTTTNTNKGGKVNSKIIDSTATLSVRTLRSGMMSGITSPARPWFKLETPDPELNEFQPVKEWLTTVGVRMRNTFLKSNLYNILPITYGDLGTFGTSAVLVEEDSESVVKFYPLALGSYAIAQNSKLMVDTFYREFRLTVTQLIDKFGEQDKDGKVLNWEVFSTHVKDMYEKGDNQTWIDCYHFIVPNKHYDSKKLHSKYKKFSSIYYERGSYTGQIDTSSPDNRALRISGYDYFPVLAPRWEVTGEDVYGTDCPGMTALGDIKQLQKGESKGLKAIDKMIDPAMVGPSSLKNSKASILPGDITYLERQDAGAFRAAHEVRFDLNALEGKQAQVRNRIQKTFFEDLFLMLASSDRRQITATEIDERREEKLLALGPVLEQLNQDFLDPLIDITFTIMMNQGILPEPPEELEGMELKVEYISIMAQAQKLVGIGAVERAVGFISQMAQLDPSALDKLDIDQTIDIYGDLSSAPLGVVRSDEVVAQIRGERQQAQAQQAEMQQAQRMIGDAKTLSETSLDGENALNEVAQLAGIGGVGE